MSTRTTQPTHSLAMLEEARSAGLLDAFPTDAAQRLVAAAVERFASDGYHATTTRDLAQLAGVSPAALYVHFKSKADLLGWIVVRGHRTLLEHLYQSVATEDRAEERFQALTETFVLFHAKHRAVAKVANYNLGALESAAFAEVRDVRREMETLFQRELAGATEAARIPKDEIRYVGLAVMSLALDLVRWYDPGRHLEPGHLASLYARLSLQMVLGAPRDA